jgi:hypothetical protein
MEIRSLIILAAKADSEGNFRVADRLTAKIETMSREAARVNFGPLAEQFLQGLGAIKIKGPAHLHTPKLGNTVYKGYEMPIAKVKELRKIHLDEIKAGRNSGQASPAGQQAAAAPGTAVPGTAAPGVPTPGVPTPGQTQTQQQIVNNYLNSPIPGKKGNTGNKGKDGRDGIDGAQGIQGIQGLKGDTGPQGPAGKWWPGVVAGLLSGAIGTGGVAAWLASKGADSASISQIEDRLDNHFKANQLSARTQAGQMDNQQAAQDFIESRRGNPKFNTAQDFYYEAQRMGYPPSMMNSIAALAKAEGFQDLTRFQD